MPAGTRTSLRPLPGFLRAQLARLVARLTLCPILPQVSSEERRARVLCVRCRPPGWSGGREAAVRLCGHAAAGWRRDAHHRSPGTLCAAGAAAGRPRAAVSGARAEVAPRAAEGSQRSLGGSTAAGLQATVAASGRRFGRLRCWNDTYGDGEALRVPFCHAMQREDPGSSR